MNETTYNYQLAISYLHEGTEYTDFLFEDEIRAEERTINKVTKVQVFKPNKTDVLSGKEAKEYLTRLNKKNS
jgi:hypothetical protein